MVFIHEIDPAFPPEQQEELRKTHSGEPLPPLTQQNIDDITKGIPKDNFPRNDNLFPGTQNYYCAPNPFTVNC